MSIATGYLLRCGCCWPRARLLLPIAANCCAAFAARLTQPPPLPCPCSWLRWRGARPPVEITVILAVAYLSFYVGQSPAKVRVRLAPTCGADRAVTASFLA